MVGVRAINANESSKLPPNWLRIKTSYDPKKAPSNPQANHIHEKVIFFSWEHSCHFSVEHPPYYVFRIHDLTMDVIEEKHLDRLWYRFDNIPTGAEYNISVSTPAIGAEAFVWHHQAPPLPIPQNLRSISFENCSFIFDWDVILIDGLK